MKHVVILNIGEGDEIMVVGIYDDAITAIGYAKSTAKEFSKQFFDDMHSDWKNGSFGDADDEPTLEAPTEKFHVGEAGDYEFSVTAESLMHEWIVHPVK